MFFARVSSSGWMPSSRIARHLVGDGLERGTGLVRAGLRADPEDADLGGRVVVGADGADESPFADGAVESRGAALSEHRREEVERGRVRVQRTRRAPPPGDVALLHVAGQLAVSQTFAFGLLGRGLLGDLAGRHVAVVLFDQLEGTLGIDVADDDEHNVRGSVQSR